MNSTKRIQARNMVIKYELQTILNDCKNVSKMYVAYKNIQLVRLTHLNLIKFKFQEIVVGHAIQRKKMISDNKKH